MRAFAQHCRPIPLYLALFLLCFLSGCAGGSLGAYASIYPNAPSRPVVHKFNLSARQGLRDLTDDFSVRDAGADTGIAVQPGEKVEIFADGVAGTGPDQRQLGPQGLPRCHELTMPEPSLTCYAVIYSVGVSGRAGEVGLHVGFNPATEGNLFLGINGPNLARNSGSFQITVVIVPSGTLTGLWASPQNGFAVQGTSLTISAYIFAQNAVLNRVVFMITLPGQTPVSICQAFQSGEDLYTCDWDLTENGNFFPNGQVMLGFRVEGNAKDGTALMTVINPDGLLTGTITYVQTDINDNYAGYAATNFDQPAAYQKVSGRWVVPPAHCSPGEDSDASVWVGMTSDETDQSLLAQLGSATDCQGGQPLYYLWWEAYPAPSVQLDFPLQVGDSVTASVAFQHGTFLLSLDVPGERVHFSVSQPGKVSDTKVAECIVEPATIVDDPATNKGHLLSLTDFDQVTIQCQLNGNEPIAAGPQNILYQMQTYSGVAKAFTSVLDASGKTFTVQWHHA
jgi:hypothetical protein